MQRFLGADRHDIRGGKRLDNKWCLNSQTDFTGAVAHNLIRENLKHRRLERWLSS